MILRTAFILAVIAGVIAGASVGQLRKVRDPEKKDYTLQASMLGHLFSGYGIQRGSVFSSGSHVTPVDSRIYHSWDCDPCIRVRPRVKSDPFHISL